MSSEVPVKRLRWTLRMSIRRSGVKEKTYIVDGTITLRGQLGSLIFVRVRDSPRICKEKFSRTPVFLPNLINALGQNLLWKFYWLHPHVNRKTGGKRELSKKLDPIDRCGGSQCGRAMLNEAAVKARKEKTREDEVLRTAAQIGFRTREARGAHSRVWCARH
ncbi:hypothetical protein AC578_7205 [Pseudocercospora eumusae]|uniref:Uncharacterized protein n=1 Tax=Pseudocercospora eumusae TaxID=321146 RepID=A0A139HX98_9PEZI|nr:hypothetical protein AC578_7205 [Pseudocercospora eumusae]